ncbi:uncharacterized protein [Leptinotarsa decemlineata]|uniref:uncharacterized protein n=1 Tax=Leptinotarsa decemlineata TaxID=7539 RepID=UPI003D30CAB3
MSQVNSSISSSSDRLSLMKLRFSAELVKIRNASAKNSFFEDDYKKLVLEVEDAKAKPRKEHRHYWLLNRYDSQPDREFKFIMVYQDHLTKFVILKPLKTKTAEEVAYHLVDIFTLIGAPSILQSDNGREFANKIVYNLKDYWPTLKIVHGKPRHSQSQGSVERANQDIENMISTWMQDEKTDRWRIKRTPYEALFGCKVKVGLTTSSLPRDILDSINSEEDLERVVNNMHTTETQTISSLEPPLQTDHNTSEVNEATVDVSGCDDTEKILLCVPCFNSENIDKERKRSKACLEKQAKKMKANSDKKFPPVTKGVTIRVPIPDVDKGRGDLRNILAVVMDTTEDGFYKLGTANGVLKQLYAGSQFTVCTKSLVRVEDVPDQETGLRTVATAQSTGSGQGFTQKNNVQTLIEI